jgi:hypothetical protein
MNDAEQNKLRERVEPMTRLDPAVFESRWRTTFGEFKKWQSGPIGQNSSRLTGQLELFRRLCRSFPEARLLEDDEIISLVIFDAKSVGDRLSMPLQKNQAVMVQVVRRQISDRFGICYTLEAPDGSRFTREFFD